jgi:hypothetical protein
MATLSDLVYRKDVWVQCVLCTHYTRWRVVDLQSKCGYDVPLVRVLSKMKCSNCATYSAKFVFRQPETDLRLLERFKSSK